MAKVTVDRERIDDLLGRYVQAVFPSKEKARDVFASGAKLRFYFGIDPTGPHIHLGHSTNLLWLKKYHALGHEVVLLVGDFTARIGDPTDKMAARTALTKEEVSANMATYLEQIGKILPEGTFTVEYNSSWLAPLTFEEVIKLASHVTVKQMLSRDMFQERLKGEKPIFLHEFFYPLMQGYDSVALRTDGELCGNDQTFNALMGRDLERALLDKDKLVITTTLLENPTTGKKIMNKSEGTAIFMDDSPQEMRRKVLALDDDTIPTVFRLCTEKPMDWIDERERAVRAGENPRNFKEELAAELVRMYHGDAAVEEAAQAVQITATGPLDEVLKKSGLAASMSEAKRLIDQGAVLVNGKVAERWDMPIAPGDTLRVGKGKFARVA